MFVENALVFLDPKIGGPGPPWAKAQCDGEVGLFKGYTRLHGNILYYPASKYVMHGGSFSASIVGVAPSDCQRLLYYACSLHIYRIS